MNLNIENMEQETPANQADTVGDKITGSKNESFPQKSTVVDEHSVELKQSFLLAAITDVSSYIHLTDTKVSIIMGAVVALIAGMLSCYNPLYVALKSICPCTWKGVVLIIDVVIWAVSLICIFVFGLLTVRGHSSKLNYPSKWYLTDTGYSFDKYLVDLKAMMDKDVIENTAAELFKLNDINRQKSRTMRWTLRSFAAFLITLGVFAVLVLLVK